jgi:hypothetical protein
MAANRTLKRTATPGVYRRGKSYMVTYRVNGKQRKRYARTFEEARDLKASLATDIRRGEYRERSVVTFEDYAREWIDSYTGRTTRGFRDSTRKGYRFSIEKRAIPFFRKRTATLVQIEPREPPRGSWRRFLLSDLSLPRLLELDGRESFARSV